MKKASKLQKPQNPQKQQKTQKPQKPTKVSQHPHAGNKAHKKQAQKVEEKAEGGVIQANKKKEIISFNQRFKEKINVVGKLGVLDLLGLHQPFNLERNHMPVELGGDVNNIGDSRLIKDSRLTGDKRGEAKSVIQNRQPKTAAQGKSVGVVIKRKTSLSEQGKMKSLDLDSKQRTNHTNIPNPDNPTQKLLLPRISKSSLNLQNPISQDPSSSASAALSTRQYWRAGKNKREGNSRRSMSLLNCINVVKSDQEAYHHFQSLAKFQKINHRHQRKLLKIDRK